VNHELLTVDEAAKLLEIDAETVRRWVERGLPASGEASGDVRIARADLDAFLAREGQGRSRDAAEEG
jgi:excisionase family DNA binding protein